MTRLLICGIIFCAIGGKLLAQEDKFLPPGYFSQWEYQTLNDPRSPTLDLLLAAGKFSEVVHRDDVAEQISEFVTELKEDGILKMSETKLVKTLHQKIHERFLKKYELVSPFYQIFESGTYNCVSATALCAYVLEELNISYSIQELPNHVYLIAWPGGKSVQIEMTSPNDGYFVPSRREISKAVNALREAELIDEYVFLNKDDSEIYNLVFFNKSTITLNELAGLQYFNEAIVLLEKNQLYLAFDEILKAELLINNTRVQVFKSFLLTEILESSSFQTTSEFCYLLTYVNQPRANIDKAKYEYVKILENQLNNGRKKFVDSTFTLIQLMCEDTLDRNALSAVYYLGITDYYANSRNYTKALEYAEAGLKLEHDDVQLQTYFAELLGISIANENDYEFMIDEYEAAMAKYGFLQTNVRFQRVYFYACYETAMEHYDDDEGDVADDFFEKALEIYSKLEDPDLIDDEDLGWLYAEKGAYLYRENKYQQAMEVLTEGLKLSPNHQRLLARIKIVKDKMNGGVDEDKEYEEMDDYEPKVKLIEY